MLANNTMTFYGQEKVEYNAQLCLMNLAVHGLTGVIKSGDEAICGFRLAWEMANELNHDKENRYPLSAEEAETDTCSML